MSLHVLIPCKSLRESKSRLASVLNEDQRAALSLRLLNNTMSLTTALAPATRCHVITDDLQASDAATKKGFSVFLDKDQGLNAALHAARNEITLRDTEIELLVLPIDLPRATEDALRELIETNAAIGIAPDRKLEGTNALYLNQAAARDFPFLFGENSFKLHCAAAHQGALKLGIYANAALSFDLDTPEHWKEMQEDGEFALG